MLSWFFTVMIVTLFLLPFYLKWNIDISNPYFKDKKTVYEGIIIKDYHEFKKTYTDLFRERYQLDIQVKEIYLDAPFNTEKIADIRSFKSQDDFFERFSS
jgi:hypothetical protein